MGRVFISYGRKDSGADANALYQSLVAVFGEDALFKDVDNVELGANWKVAIREAVRESSVLLLLMGPSWKLSDAIAIEVTTALDAQIPIIPLLVNGAKMRDLAASLEGTVAAIGDLNAASLDHSSWNRDLAPVIEAVRKQLEPRAGAVVRDRRASPTPGRASWRAQVLTWDWEATPSSIAIKVWLSDETHDITHRANLILPGGLVEVDGKEVSKAKGIFREHHRFWLRDGNEQYQAELLVTGVKTGEIELVVDETRLLSARK